MALTYVFHEDRRQGFARAYSLEDYSNVPEYQGDATAGGGPTTQATR